MGPPWGFSRSVDLRLFFLNLPTVGFYKVPSLTILASYAASEVCAFQSLARSLGLTFREYHSGFPPSFLLKGLSWSHCTAKVSWRLRFVLFQEGYMCSVCALSAFQELFDVFFSITVPYNTVGNQTLQLIKAMLIYRECVNLSAMSTFHTCCSP